MEKFMNFLKENFYYVMGAFVIFVVLIVLIVIFSSNAGVSSYQKLETNLINAAKKYYSENKSKLPKKEKEIITISSHFLVENKYIKELKDPKDRKNICTGRVEVNKVSDSYNYLAFIDCNDSYRTEFLTDAIKLSLKHDDNGNGLYAVGNEYVFKGDNVKNYVNFNDELWRVIKIDKDGDIKLISE